VNVARAIVLIAKIKKRPSVGRTSAEREL
jgi:hypothetical protein